ncbi:membrane protein [Cystoisospora suis]|uniref:Membrane protein n=1 Tax=Cystoisospora suis TaxID=483139 RepID=A0A2C6KG74_9APIC|nr:membrane protein [Cystoisospora suis]
MYAFSHIPTRRIGFMDLPIATLVIACLPAVPWFSSTSSIVCAVLVWISLLFVKVLFSLIIVAFATKRRKNLKSLEPSFGKINSI